MSVDPNNLGVSIVKVLVSKFFAHASFENPDGSYHVPGELVYTIFNHNGTQTSICKISTEHGVFVKDVPLYFTSEPVTGTKAREAVMEYPTLTEFDVELPNGVGYVFEVKDIRDANEYYVRAEGSHSIGILQANVAREVNVVVDNIDGTVPIGVTYRADPSAYYNDPGNLTKFLVNNINVSHETSTRQVFSSKKQADIDAFGDRYFGGGKPLKIDSETQLDEQFINYDYASSNEAHYFLQTETTIKTHGKGSYYMNYPKALLSPSYMPDGAQTLNQLEMNFTNGYAKGVALPTLRLPVADSISLFVRVYDRHKEGGLSAYMGAEIFNFETNKFEYVGFYNGGWG